MWLFSRCFIIIQMHEIAEYFIALLTADVGQYGNSSGVQAALSFLKVEHLLLSSHVKLQK